MYCSPSHLNMFRIYIHDIYEFEDYGSSTMGIFHHILFLSLSHSFFLRGNVEAQKQGGDPNPEAVDRECDTRFAMLRCGSGAVKQPFVDQPFVVQFCPLQVIISILILYYIIIRRYILFLQKVIQIFFWNNNAEEINRQ